MKIASVLIAILLAAGWLPASAFTSCGGADAVACCCQPDVPEPVSCCGGEIPLDSASSGHECECRIELPASPLDTPAAPANSRVDFSITAPFADISGVAHYDDNRIVRHAMADYPPGRSPPVFILICSLLQ